MENEIKLLNKEFKSLRSQTYAILEKLTSEQLFKKWNRPGLDTFAKHFIEISEVQNVYAEALSTGAIDFSKVTNSCPENTTKEILREFLNNADHYYDKSIKEISIKEINWYGELVDVIVHLTRLLSHESYHLGMMTLEMYQQRITIPRCMQEAWALPTNENNI